MFGAPETSTTSKTAYKGARMSWDAEALIRQIQESTRTIDLATTEIINLRERIHDLQVENERLRARLASFGDRMRRMEEGEL